MKLEFKEDTHQYFKEDGTEVPSVTTILDYVTSRHYGSINQSVLERAKLRGTAVHEALEMMDYGAEVEVESEILGFCKAYADFLNDYRPTWESIEKVAFSDNGDHSFCGTVDRAGKMNGKPCVLDIKTTSSPTKENYISVCAQTSAYAIALGIPNAKRYALYLKSDGTYRLVDCEKYEDKHGFYGGYIFLKCLELYATIKGVK